MSMIYRMFFTKISINIYNDNILLELKDMVFLGKYSDMNK